MRSLADVIDGHAVARPDATAFVEGDAAHGAALDWAGYARRSERLAALLVELGLAPGERLAVLLPDGPGVHVAYVGAEKAGLVVMGIGPRAGAAEIHHLLARSAASALLSRARHRDLDLPALVATLRAQGLPLRHHLVVEGELEEDAPLRADGRELPRAPAAGPPQAGRRLGLDDVFLLNSTSGTTGMPKCVVHDQRRWLHFHELAVEAGELSPRDVFLSALPAPFGFGLWTGHFTPTLLGAPTVLLARFAPDALVRAIERHRVTVLAAVSTQFLMMLDSPELPRRDVSSLRVLFTGGEAVPAARAAEFEERTGAKVLQFYGSNETGALSRTTLRDPREVRLHTAGRVIESMHVRLFDDTGGDVTKEGLGQPGCRGPLLSRGYWDDPDANRELVRADGWMLTGDVASLDERGVLRVIGRRGDFIIRGGKNVSAAAVEEAAARHPAVALAAAVAMPDPTFGERVCLYAVLRAGHRLGLEELVAHMRADGVSPETLPEWLEVVEELPRSSGGKIAKAALRQDLRRRLEQRQRQGQRVGEERR